MTTFQIIIRKVGVHFSKPIWSFIRNCVFWLFRLNEIDWVRNQMKDLRAWQLEPLMTIFTWQEDKAGDWTQWIVTLVENNLTGDCDDAAALAKWWFKQHGIKSDIFNLYSAAEGHTVCVTKNRETMVTNERVVNLNPTCWEKEVMEYFGNKYEVVI
jgi:hypothetical protein